MEKHLERVLDEIASDSTVEGCMLVDRKGLCWGSKGNAEVDKAGLVAVIAQQAAKLEPQNGCPVIRFENDKRVLMIQSNGDLSCAIYQNLR